MSPYNMQFSLVTNTFTLGICTWYQLFFSLVFSSSFLYGLPRPWKEIPMWIQLMNNCSLSCISYWASCGFRQWTAHSSSFMIPLPWYCINSYIYIYCTKPTKCSAQVICDAFKQLKQMFKAPIEVWHWSKLFNINSLAKDVINNFFQKGGYS